MAHQQILTNWTKSWSMGQRQVFFSLFLHCAPFRFSHVSSFAHHMNQSFIHFLIVSTITQTRVYFIFLRALTFFSSNFFENYNERNFTSLRNFQEYLEKKSNKKYTYILRSVILNCHAYLRASMKLFLFWKASCALKSFPVGSK